MRHGIAGEFRGEQGRGPAEAGPRPNPEPYLADRISGVILAVLAVVAALLLSGCPAMQQAYATYDAAYERELVAGHDSVRGDYVEFRVKPRPRALTTIATSAASDGRNADAAGTAGKTVVPAQGGKAVLP
jgi:hypothetical protein